MKISAIILTRNEEVKLSNCLQHLNFVDQIIIIDNGSSDKTLKIAREFAALIFHFQGTDFAKARSIGAQKAIGDWLLYIDADEIVSEDLAREINKSLNNDFAAYEIRRENYFYGQLFPVVEFIIRLIRKSNFESWQGRLHESPIVEGKIGRLENSLLHFTHDNLSKMVEKTNLWSEIEADNRFKLNHPQIVKWRLLRVIFTEFFNNYIIKKSFKLGTLGFIESIYQSFSIFITYAKLWERQNKIKKS